MAVELPGLSFRSRFGNFISTQRPRTARSFSFSRFSVNSVISVFEKFSVPLCLCGKKLSCEVHQPEDVNPERAHEMPVPGRDVDDDAACLWRLCSQLVIPAYSNARMPPNKCTAWTPVRIKKNELLALEAKVTLFRSRMRHA